MKLNINEVVLHIEERITKMLSDRHSFPLVCSFYESLGIFK